MRSSNQVTTFKKPSVCLLTILNSPAGGTRGSASWLCIYLPTSGHLHSPELREWWTSEHLFPLGHGSPVPSAYSALFSLLSTLISIFQDPKQMPPSSWSIPATDVAFCCWELMYFVLPKSFLNRCSVFECMFVVKALGGHLFPDFCTEHIVSTQ